MVSLIASLILSPVNILPNLTLTSSLDFQQQGPQFGQQGRRRPPGGAPDASAAPTAPATTPGIESMAQRDNRPDRWVQTHHSITINGQQINYTATCGYLPVANRDGTVQANMFFVAYTKDGEDAHKRPITFAFNGGPGSSSVWMHMGAIGPVRAEMTYHGFMPKPPFRYTDNQESWIPFTDIVMLDAVGTGYSETVTPGDRQFYNVQGDLGAFTSAITHYVTDENRWLSPVFVAGESYGGFRVAGLSNSLLQAGVACSGIISVSGVLNFPTIDGGKDNDLPFISFLPSECGVAWYHKKLSPAMEGDLLGTIKKCEDFARGEYAHALMMGSDLSAADRDHVAAELSSYMGISKKFILQADLRVPEFEFMGKLLADEHTSVGRYDARVTGYIENTTRPSPDYDASDAASSPVFTAAFNDYIKTQLKFDNPMAYKIMGGVPGWDEETSNDTSDMLRRAMTENPTMQVMFAFGRFDLACPYFGTRYVVDHMQEPAALRSNIHFQYYPAGHMVYLDTPSRIKLQKDVMGFETGAVVGGGDPATNPDTPMSNKGN